MAAQAELYKVRHVLDTLTTGQGAAAAQPNAPVVSVPSAASGGGIGSAAPPNVAVIESLKAALNNAESSLRVKVRVNVM